MTVDAPKTITRDHFSATATMSTPSILDPTRFTPTHEDLTMDLVFSGPTELFNLIAQTRSDNAANEPHFIVDFTNPEQRQVYVPRTAPVETIDLTQTPDSPVVHVTPELIDLTQDL